MLPNKARMMAFVGLALLAMASTSRDVVGAEQAAAQKPIAGKTKNMPALEPKKEDGKKAQEKETELEQIAHLISQLGDSSFEEREAASRELNAIGKPALGALRKAAAFSNDAEIRRRAERIVEDIVARGIPVAFKNEIAALQGAWYSTRTEVGGVRQSGENRADRHFFSGNQWICLAGETLVQAAKITVVDVTNKQVQIDFLITEGPRKGDTWVGIYERNGDELKWCGGYVGEGHARPATLATKEGDGYFLRSLKRQKK